MRFDLEIRGDEQASRRISKMAGRARRMRPALSDSADVLINAERRSFRSRRWEPLAASTLEWRERQGTGKRVLHETGTLESALTVRGAPGQLLTFKKDTVTFGLKSGRAPAFYGRFHQTGQGVPKRVVIPKPTARTRREMAKIVKRHLTS